MSRNRLPGILKKLQTNRQKKPGETMKETSGCVKPERFNKWRMLAKWWWWWWWWRRRRRRHGYVTLERAVKNVVHKWRRL